MILKFIKEHQVLIIGAAIAVLLFLMYVRKPQPDTKINDIIAAKDETIKAVQRERDVYREWKDSTVAALNARNTQLEKDYGKTQIKYDKVPTYIISLSKDSLRAEGERTARGN